jgi:hypothetical protein
VVQRHSLTAPRLVQGTCYDFMQPTYKEWLGNNTMYTCMKDKMESGLPVCDAISAIRIAMATCAPPVGGGGGGWDGMRRSAHNTSTDNSCNPGPPPSSIPLTKETYDSVMKGLFKGMTEATCDPDSEVKDEDRDK